MISSLKMSSNEKIWSLMEYFSSSDGAVGAYQKKKFRSRWCMWSAKDSRKTL